MACVFFLMMSLSKYIIGCVVCGVSCSGLGGHIVGLFIVVNFVC